MWKVDQYWVQLNFFLKFSLIAPETMIKLVKGLDANQA